MKHEARATQGATRRLWPWLAILLTTAAAAFGLRAGGRLWACSCGRFRVWTGEAWGAETSQQLLDPYSFTHLLHGVLFCGALALIAPRLRWKWRLWLAIAAEAAWEVFENSEMVIRRYREATAALGYTGDTVVNSLGDMLACGLGFVLARRLGWRRSALLFAATEVLLLVWIRDSLLLNILMLIYPLDAIRAWQAGH
jgi:hypothetical protein